MALAREQAWHVLDIDRRIGWIGGLKRAHRVGEHSAAATPFAILARVSREAASRADDDRRPVFHGAQHQRSQSITIVT
jgi:hypothetical protein